MPFSTAADIIKFALAGSAITTLESEKTGAHYTYKIDQIEGSDRFMVKLLTGPNNSDDFTYIGMIFGRTFRLTAKSKLPETAAPVAGFAYFWRAVAADRMPANMIVRHDDHCSRCRRHLTTPESLERGIGPDCAEAMGLAPPERARKPRKAAEVVSRPQLAAEPSWL